MCSSDLVELVGAGPDVAVAEAGLAHATLALLPLRAGEAHHHQVVDGRPGILFLGHGYGGQMIILPCPGALRSEAKGGGAVSMHWAYCKNWVWTWSRLGWEREKQGEYLVWLGWLGE